MTQAEFRKWVKHWMIDNDKNQSDIANNLGISSAAVSAYIGGRKTLSPKFVKYFGYKKQLVIVPMEASNGKD